MKLRNKKTGVIGELSGVNRIVVYEPDMPLCENSILGEYDTLAELNKDWEDYNPAEPLIKDEKIRKAVRAWADMNKIEKAGIQKIITEERGLEDSWYQITGQDKNMCLWKIEIHASYSETVRKDYKGGAVSITELCGEEG